MSPTFDMALQVLTDRLGERALEHCLRVAETARSLALIYGVDADDARLAGLLHDWDRELDHDSLLEAIRDCEVEDHGDAFKTTELLHATTGAVALREEFPGISTDVVRAVERHTLGAPDMQPLDMIVYVADSIEPGRTHRGVNDLRETVGTVSLEDLFAEAFRQTVSHLVTERRHLHPVTIAVWNSHVARGRS